MIPAPFGYVRAESVGHATGLLAEHGDEAKLLAGGHSLLPMMKLRLAAPSLLVDVAALAELRYIRAEDGELAVGALTRHADLAGSDAVRAAVPLLGHVAGLIGDPQIRHRGTIGGSLAHADPAADLPTAVTALDATLVISGPAGSRRVPATEFFDSYFTTVLAEDEMLVEIRFPAMSSARWAYQKFTRRANDWAIVAVAVADGRVALANMGATPIRAAETERALAAGASAAEAAALADRGTEPTEDMHADRDYRRHLARLLTRRALLDAG
jgi:carbon-monoxide dehydrogenase medium subunit